MAPHLRFDIQGAIQHGLQLYSDCAIEAAPQVTGGTTASLFIRSDVDCFDHNGSILFDFTEDLGDNKASLERQ